MPKTSKKPAVAGLQTRGATSAIRQRSNVATFPPCPRLITALERLSTFHDGRPQLSPEQRVAWKAGVLAALEVVRMTSEGCDTLTSLPACRDEAADACALHGCTVHDD